MRIFFTTSYQRCDSFSKLTLQQACTCKHDHSLHVLFCSFELNFSPKYSETCHLATHQYGLLAITRSNLLILAGTKPQVIISLSKIPINLLDKGWFLWLDGGWINGVRLHFETFPVTRVIAMFRFSVYSKKVHWRQIENAGSQTTAVHTTTWNYLLENYSILKSLTTSSNSRPKSKHSSSNSSSAKITIKKQLLLAHWKSPKM